MARVASVNSGMLVEASDRWLLPLAGKAVRQCCIDHAVNLRCEGEVEIRIEAPLVFKGAEGVEQLLLPEGDPARLAPVLRVARLVVVEASAFKDGHLELKFEGGTTITVAAAEDLEPWEIVGPGGLRIVSVPGGQLAVWRPIMP